MSVINKMLQELDRRNASAGTESEQPPQQVKVVVSRGGHEWFWRIVAALMLVAVGWVVWVAYQLQPRQPVVTELALKAAEQARKGPIVNNAPRPTVVAPASAPSPVAAPGSVPVAPVAAAPQGVAVPAVPSASAPESPKPSAREVSETFKLAKEIETPLAERAATTVPAKPESPKPEAPRAVTSKLDTPNAAPKSAPRPRVTVPDKGRAHVDKRDRSRTASESAEAQFRRAAVYLNQGRVSEAESQLVGALHADPSHVGARQAYVSLLLEQKRTDAAKRVLAEALAKEPAQPVFSLALARILAEQRDYQGALEVMDRAGSVAQNADFQAVRGAVLQRLNRHQEAVDAYLAAVQGGIQPGTTWVGLGISLEALGRKTEAVQAYRRSLAGVLAPQVRDYADSRVRALE